MLPNLIIIGAYKAGTSSLFDYLRTHPQICTANQKEIHYYYPAVTAQPLEPIATYQTYFAGCEPHIPYIMEASPMYYLGGTAIIEAMQTTLSPHLRLLCIVREPVSRLISDWRYRQSRLKLSRETTLEAFVDQCLSVDAEQLQADLRHPLRGIEAGMYARQLQPWLEAFPTTLKVVFFDQLERDPAALLIKLADWLGIATREFDFTNLQPRNRALSYKNETLQWIALRVRDACRKYLRDYPGLRHRLLNLYLAINGDNRAPAVDEATIARLTALYVPHNREFAALLRQHGYTDLPAWLNYPHNII